MTSWKDYSLSGFEGQRKVEAGLASAQWYACPVPRKIMKELMQRRDGPAIRNPVFRFIYWNMNYHLEHHMFPMVPYHALPKLHEAMKADSPPSYPSLLAAWREILPALWRQIREPHYFVERLLSATALHATE